MTVLTLLDPQSSAVAFLSLSLLCAAQSNDATSSHPASAAAIAALGTIIGYIGSEVVDEEIFERLLWPERFYNNSSLPALLKFVVFFPMGGPLHSAAIRSLMSLRANNLYRGALQGDMLGTSFYTDLQSKYFARSDPREAQVEKEARNALLIRILRLLRPSQITLAPASRPADLESEPEHIRTTAFVHHLQINYSTASDVNRKGQLTISEKLSLRTVAGLVCSELSAITMALVAGFGMKSWFGLWWCAPLFLKAVATIFRVRREPLKINNNEDSSLSKFEVIENGCQFCVIEGPNVVIRQFFRHYGHPRRDSRDRFIPDRMKEIVSMITVFLYGTIFPVGLLAITVWLDIEVQILWLAYQLYVSLAMLICRLVGGSVWGTTEERVAYALSRGKQVVFEKSIIIRLDTRAFSKVSLARDRVRELLG